MKNKNLNITETGPKINCIIVEGKVCCV